MQGNNITYDHTQRSNRGFSIFILKRYAEYYQNMQDHSSHDHLQNGSENFMRYLTLIKPAPTVPGAGE